jgi:hypothetical protein
MNVWWGTAYTGTSPNRCEELVEGRTQQDCEHESRDCSRPNTCVIHHHMYTRTIQFMWMMIFVQSMAILVAFWSGQQFHIYDLFMIYL